MRDPPIFSRSGVFNKKLKKTDKNFMRRASETNGAYAVLV